MRELLDLVFPPRCAGCDLPGTLLCERCRSELPLIEPAHACPRCGAPDGRVRCRECHDRAFAFSGARCAALLEPPVSRAVVVLKDGGERRYAMELAHLLAECSSGWLGAHDVLVPVAAAPGAVRRRGFDHAADIARALARLTDTPMERVLRSAPSADQRALGREARFVNRAASFRVRPGHSPPASTVLVDDVFTTGATFDAAARVLIAAGSTRVRVLAVARACT